MSVSSLKHFSTVSPRQALKATGNYFTFVLNKHCHLVMHLTDCVCRLRSVMLFFYFPVNAFTHDAEIKALRCLWSQA